MKRGIDFGQSTAGRVLLPFKNPDESGDDCTGCVVVHCSHTCQLLHCVGTERPDGLQVIWKEVLSSELAQAVLSMEEK